MTSNPDVRASRLRRGAIAVAVALALVAVPVLAWRLSGDEPAVQPLSPTASTTTTSGAPDQTSVRAADGAAVVGRLVAALGQDGPSVAEIAMPGDTAARDQLRGIIETSRALGIEGWTGRFVAEDAGLNTGTDARSWIGHAVFEATAPVLGPLRFETAVRIVDTPDGPRFGGTGAAAVKGEQVGPAPTWWSEPMRVRQEGRVVILAPAAASAASLFTQSREALRQVRRVLPEWKGQLVVEMPATQAAIENALNAPPGSYSGIAATTTTPVGVQRGGTGAAYVLLNPPVWSALGPRAAQVVLTHEAVHVARGANRTPAPLWVVEGVADYVALRDGGVPARRAAARYLDKVRDAGLPRSLPSEDDFDARRQGLGATYESAWLACRLIAEKYGERRLLRFADALDGGASLERAFRSELGTTSREFLRLWRRDLARLAGIERGRVS